MTNVNVKESQDCEYDSLWVCDYEYETSKTTKSVSTKNDYVCS